MRGSRGRAGESDTERKWKEWRDGRDKDGEEWNKTRAVGFLGVLSRETLHGGFQEFWGILREF